MKNISLNVILAAGIVLIFLTAFGLFWAGIRPVQAEIDDYDRYIGELQTKANQEPAARRLLAESEMIVALASQRDMELRERRMPKSTISMGDRLQAWVSYHDMIREIGKKIEHWPAKTGVTLLSGFELPPPPTDPNAIPTKLITFEIGEVNVRAATFERLLSHMAAWNRVPNLTVVTDGLEISGVSPQLNGRYTMRAYVFPKGEAGAPVKSGSGGGAAPGAGGMGGGPATFGGGGRVGM